MTTSELEAVLVNLMRIPNGISFLMVQMSTVGAGAGWLAPLTPGVLTLFIPDRRLWVAAGRPGASCDDPRFTHLYRLLGDVAD